MSFHRTKSEHEVAYQELVALVRRHAGKLSSLELLAVAANMVGKLVAMQDQRTVTPAEAMDVVLKNMEHGNQQVVTQLEQHQGTA